jgi:excisionase family DNA binding protein
MAAYATHQREVHVHSIRPSLDPAGPRLGFAAESSRSSELSIIDQLVDRVAERVVALLNDGLPEDSNQHGDWLDSRHAAEYLGLHRDTLRKLAAERAIPSEQDGPGCKLYFRRSDLDAWRRGGGRPRHLASVVADAA